MKVLFISQTAAIGGGVERWLASLCTGLAARGIEVVLALADGTRFHRADAYLKAYPELAALPYVIVSCTSGMPGERQKALVETIRRIAPDIVVPVLLQDVIAAVAICRGKGQKLKLVYPVHESEIWVYNSVVENKNHIDAVTSVNRLMVEALHKFAGFEYCRLFHIRGGVNLAFERLPIAQALPMTVSIGYCGKLVQNQKRILDVIEFCDALDHRSVSYRFYIAGSGSDADSLFNKLNSHIEAGRVVVLGNLSIDALYRDFYPVLDVLLITSDRETGPLVAWEAMMHGALILTSAYRGLRSEGFLQHRENALVFPVGQPVDAAEELLSIFGDPVRFLEMRELGRKSAERCLTVEKMVDDWLDAFVKILQFPELKGTPATGLKAESSFHNAIEGFFRRMLKRPIWHGNSHQEWPHYTVEPISSEARDDFVRQLDELEQRTNHYDETASVSRA